MPTLETKGLCVDLVELARAPWRKAHTADGAESSVEVAFVADAVAVRDSKNRTLGAQFYTRAEWDAFLTGVKNGEFDR